MNLCFSGCCLWYCACDLCYGGNKNLKNQIYVAGTRAKAYINHTVRHYKHSDVIYVYNIINEIDEVKIHSIRTEVQICK